MSELTPERLGKAISKYTKERTVGISPDSSCFYADLLWGTYLHCGDFEAALALFDIDQRRKIKKFVEEHYQEEVGSTS